jgi:hypothetical protein
MSQPPKKKWRKKSPPNFLNNQCNHGSYLRPLSRDSLNERRMEVSTLLDDGRGPSLVFV